MPRLLALFAFEGANSIATAMIWNWLQARPLWTIIVALAVLYTLPVIILYRQEIGAIGRRCFRKKTEAASSENTNSTFQAGKEQIRRALFAIDEARSRHPEILTVKIRDAAEIVGALDIPAPDVADGADHWMVFLARLLQTDGLDSAQSVRDSASFNDEELNREYALAAVDEAHPGHPFSTAPQAETEAWRNRMWRLAERKHASP